MVMPGVTTRNVSENRRSFGSAILFKACQAMSMAMTTVLPDPVAIFIAMRLSPGFDAVVGVAEPVLDPVVADLLGGLGQIDERFQGLDLAEEELVLPVGVGPVLQELARDLGNALIFPFPPVLDPFPDAVDLVVGLDAVLCPLRVKLELLALLLGRRDRDEVGTRPARLDDLVGDPLVGEPPMPVGFPKGRVEDRVLDDGVGHESPRRDRLLVCIITQGSGRVNDSGLQGSTPTRGYAASSGSTPVRGASGMVGTGAYSIGSKMPTVL